MPVLFGFFLKLAHIGALDEAIANGAGTPKAIAHFSGLEEKYVPQYLSVLTETGFIARRVPVTQPPASRMGRHFITGS